MLLLGGMVLLHSFEDNLARMLIGIFDMGDRM